MSTKVLNVHRSSTAIVTGAPARLRPRATDLHRKGVVATYKLHDRIFSNRRARSLYEASRPSLDGVQRRVVQELDTDGYSLAEIHELVSEEAWEQVSASAAAFVAETEAGLARESEGEGGELRRRAGKEFLVRKYDESGVVRLDDPWLALCSSRRLIDIASTYLQMWPKLEHLDMWYSLPVGAGGERRASQLWHRDYDDRHLLKAFLYLADVDAETGPFEYVPGSQPGGRYAGIHPWAPMTIGRISEKELDKHVPAEEVRTFTAPKGTIIFCNTSGLHRGGFAETKPRVLCTVTYCSPASLHALTRRNYSLASGTDTSPLDPVVRYALG
jgi:ectoine hydroxylase-related dioxygenase (phytanoyl-CoA dioxygenase family)